MSLFDEIQTAALDSIVDFDVQRFALYRYVNETAHDGFNGELKQQTSYVRDIEASIARSADDWIGTTTATDIQQGDILETVNARGKIRRYTVTAFEPTENHTLLTLSEARNG